ncbi:hypothetical protein [Mycobacterium sp.]|uniref:hypothetical protein n=1 Tax=Mycobacterium sp. TaxID=1785 RepID=UPI0025EC762C|nr:hypothetical protein [Mycobacterium sp.]
MSDHFDLCISDLEEAVAGTRAAVEDSLATIDPKLAFAVGRLLRLGTATVAAWRQH